MQDKSLISIARSVLDLSNGLRATNESISNVAMVVNKRFEDVESRLTMIENDRPRAATVIASKKTNIAEDIFVNVCAFIVCAFIVLMIIAFIIVAIGKVFAVLKCATGM
jgi:hypothetical protein